MMPSPTTVEPIVAATKPGCRRSSGSISGSGTRRSVATKPATRAIVATDSVSINGVSPVRASVTAATRAARPRDSSATPGTSTRRGVAAADSPSPRWLSGARASASTAVTAYDARQWSLPNAVASSTPAVMPTPRAAPHAAVARARSWPGAVEWASTARPHARTAAPPMPWTTRDATKTPVSVATRQPRAPRAVTTRPAT